MNEGNPHQTFEGGSTMYDPGKAKQEHDQLRAEIEASRTPEEREEANKIRGQRAVSRLLARPSTTVLRKREYAK